MKRRNFIKNLSYASMLPLLPACVFKAKDSAAKEGDPLQILVVSGWQDINIGDIAHTPGLLHVLQTYIPDAKITLWKRSKSDEVATLLEKNFPKIEVLYGTPEKDYSITDTKILQSIKKADIFIHGSGPSVVAENCLEAWRKLTDKPFGTFGTTIEHITPQLKNLLQDASFLFTRETASIRKLAEAGVDKPEIRFIPDATFFMHIRNDEAAASFMQEQKLEERKFICVIPRLRKTPYWLINRERYTETQIEEITTLNNKWKEIDHAKAREAIIRYVRETKNKVLICPEMTYQVDIMDELLITPLPADVKPFVQKRGYWLPDEAASLYSKAQAVLSFECHSPIIALRNGTPAFYLRQPEDTIKGQMYYDIEVTDWVFEIANTTGTQIADQLMTVVSNYNQAEAYQQKAIHKTTCLFEEGASFVAKIGK